MTSFFKIVSGFLVLILSFGLQAQAQNGDGFCCDPDMSLVFEPSNCASGTSPVNCFNDEPADCPGTVDPACIPLDGGLSLLAIAGGGLATAAMRRRREEELLEKEA